MDAFNLNGLVVLRELYHMACSNYSLKPDPSVPANSFGSALAYASMLGPTIESSWTSEFTCAGSDPKCVGELWLRTLTTQTPLANLVAGANKVCYQLIVQFEIRLMNT